VFHPASERFTVGDVNELRRGASASRGLASHKLYAHSEHGSRPDFRATSAHSSQKGFSKFEERLNDIKNSQQGSSHPASVAGTETSKKEEGPSGPSKAGIGFGKLRTASTRELPQEAN